MAVTTEELCALLKASNDFKDLADEIISELAACLKLQTIPGGQKFISEGAHSDSLFLLVSGRLRVSRTLPSGERLMYNEVLPGDCVGETGMILRQPRTADISATRESVVAVLNYQDYENAVKKYPIELSRAFSHAIYRHLRHERQIDKRGRAHSFYVLPIHDSIDARRFCDQLKKALEIYGSCEVLDEHTFESNGDYGRELDKKESSNDFLIFRGNRQFNKVEEANFEHADQLIIVADSEVGAGISKVEQQLKALPNFALMRRHLAVVHPEDETRCQDRAIWNQYRDCERVYPVKYHQAKDFERLSRFLLEKAVGVVLGGGGARGFAHLGVLRAFEEANIPIDIIGGNSMGALIGASYLAGIPLESIHKEILKHSKSGMKLTVPVVSLLSNQNLASAFRDALGETNIENLWTPFFAAACNLTDADTYVLDSGPLWKAVLASNSPAGLFPPVVNDGMLLVDGAVLENVPVRAMRQRLSTPLERRRGNGLVVAIDVDVKERFSVDADTKELTAWGKLKSHFSPTNTLPGIVDILMQVAHIGGLSQRAFTKRGADIYLEPPLSDFKIMDYKKAEQIIAVGYDYATKQISDLQAQVN